MTRTDRFLVFAIGVGGIVLALVMFISMKEEPVRTAALAFLKATVFVAAIYAIFAWIKFSRIPF